MANLPPELPPSGESVSVEPPPGSCDVSEKSPPLAPQDHGCYAQASDGSDSQMHYAMPDRQYRSMRGATPEGTSPRGQEQPDFFIMGRSALMPGDTDSAHQAPGDNVLPSEHSAELVLGHSSLLEPAFIEKPKIQSVVRVDGLRGKLKFFPNHTSARRKVQGYWITSQWEHAGWVKVFNRILAPDEVLTPEVESIIPLHLLEEASWCQYQVTMLYHDNMKVESDIFTEELDPTDTPVVSVTKNGSSMTLRFSHPPSYPKAALREDLKYKILWKNDPERDNSYPSTSGTSGSVTVSGDQGSSPSFTLRVSYKSRPGLGYIFSEKCEARAKELVEGSLSNDIEPIAIALLFCNDNLEEDVRMKKLHPPYNAQKSCALLKPALQRYGVTVIPVTNESMKCLNAVFEKLAARKFSESCELLWFIFCGHGVGNELSLNGQRYECAALIELVSAIGIDKLAFFFDCCKSHCDYIKTIDIKKDYMVLCSAPPGQVCYQKDGVSFFVSSLIEVLQNQFEGQLTKLQLEVCDKVMSRLKETPELKIPPGGFDAFRKDHLPHFNSTAFDINLYDKITSAMRPGIDVNINSPHVCITAKCPKRISDHSSFQLRGYNYVVEVEDKMVYDFSTGAGVTNDVHTAKLPLQPSEVDGKVKVGAIYDGRIVNSMPYQVKMPYCAKPEIKSFSRKDDLTGMLEFVPNQPSEDHQYIVRGYRIKSKVEGSGDWADVKEALGGGLKEEGEEVVIPLHLLDEEKMCEYQVTMIYDVGEVDSKIHRQKLNATRGPVVTMSKNGLLCSGLTVNFQHPESTHRNNLTYQIVRDSGSVDSEACTSSSSMSIEGDGLFKVKVCYSNKDKDLSRLGSIFITPSKGCVYWCSPYSKVLRNPATSLIALLILCASLFVVTIFCVIYFPRPITDQLITVNQTIPFQPTWFSMWCKGVSAEEYIVEFSDYYPGFDISAYLVNNSALMTENFTVPNDKYPGVNLTIDYSEMEQTYSVPLNYFHDPLYLLKGSVITLSSEIHIPQRSDHLTYAFVNVFDSRDKAVSYEQGNSSVSSRVHSFDVTKCTEKEGGCTMDYVIDKNSFYFFVLTSKADSPYTITTNFSFEVFHYVLPSHTSVANISKNSRGAIPFYRSTTILLYAHPPNDTDYRRLAHLKFSCSRQSPVQAGVILGTGTILLVLYIVVISLLVMYRRCRRKRKSSSLGYSHLNSHDSNSSDLQNDTGYQTDAA